MKNNNELRFVSESELRYSRVFYEISIPAITIRALIAIFSIFIILVIYIFFAPYNVVVTAQAKIRPMEDLVYITPLVNGVLKDKKFVHGDKVYKNQILYIIENDHIQKNIISSEKRKSDILFMLSQNNAILKTLEYYDKNDKIFEIYSDYNQNIIKNEILKREAEHKKAKSDFVANLNLYPESVSRTELADYEKAMNITKYNLDNYVSTEIKNYVEKINSLNQELAEMESSISMLYSELGNTVIKSSIDGYIEEIQIINKGESIIAEYQIARIIPDETKQLKVYMAIMIDDIADLQAGMNFSIYFPKHPSSEYSGISGTIVHIPMDSITDANGNCYYKVTGILDTNKLTNRRTGNEIVLLAGMSGRCKILTRTEPLYIFLLRKMNFIS